MEGEFFSLFGKDKGEAWKGKRRVFPQGGNCKHEDIVYAQGTTNIPSWLEYHKKDNNGKKAWKIGYNSTA